MVSESQTNESTCRPSVNPTRNCLLKALPQLYNHTLSHAQHVYHESAEQASTRTRTRNKKIKDGCSNISRMNCRAITAKRLQLLRVQFPKTQLPDQYPCLIRSTYKRKSSSSRKSHRNIHREFVSIEVPSHLSRCHDCAQL